MTQRVLTVGLGSLVAVMLHAQTTWAPLGGWELVERLDDVQVVKVFRPDDLVRPTFKGWTPTDGIGGSNFFPASDVMLYNRLPLSGQYYAYESDVIMLDDVNINPAFDSSGQGRFRVSRVEIAVNFPYAGVYQIQGFWVGSDGDFPPYPSEQSPLTFLRTNQGPHSVFVSQPGVWRLATNTDPNNEVFTVQTGRMGEEGTCPNRFNFYLGLLLSSPASWVCGQLPGSDCNMDYFLQYEPNSPDGPYVAYQLQGGVPATFALRVIGASAPIQTNLQGTITIDGFTGNYAGRQATIKVKHGTTIDTYTVTLGSGGAYSVQVNGSGSAEVLAQLSPGLKKKVAVDLTGGTLNQNFTLTNGDVNGDNVVDDADLLAVLFDFGGTSSQTDVNGDGVVDDADLLTVLFNFGSSGDDF